MRRQRPWAERLRTDEGAAAVELLFAGLVLLVPLVYLVVALSAIQGHQLGAESLARHLSRVVAQAVDPEEAAAHADAVWRTVQEDYALSEDRVDVTVECLPAGPCPRPGVHLVVHVSATAPLPLLPSLGSLPTGVPVTATAVQAVPEDGPAG